MMLEASWNSGSVNSIEYTTQAHNMYISGHQLRRDSKLYARE